MKYTWSLVQRTVASPTVARNYPTTGWTKPLATFIAECQPGGQVTAKQQVGQPVIDIDWTVFLPAHAASVISSGDLLLLVEKDEVYSVYDLKSFKYKTVVQLRRQATYAVKKTS